MIWMRRAVTAREKQARLAGPALRFALIFM
jgi:hypothetical protein